MRYFRKLTGDRLYLSPVNIEDLESYTRWVNDPQVTDGLGISWNVYTLEKEREYLEKMAKDDYAFAIVKKDDDSLLGNCSILEINNVHRKAMVGLFIGDEHNRNQGYGTEALRLLVDFSFNKLNLHNIMLNVFSFNKRAIASYKKLGFQEIGRRRSSYFLDGKYYDEIFMDILAEEFRSEEGVLNGK